MTKGYVPSRTRVFGKGAPAACRIEDAKRRLIAVIGRDGRIDDNVRVKLGSVGADNIIYDARNKATGSVTPDKEFLDSRNVVIAKLLSSWELVGPDEKLMAMVRDGSIYGPDRKLWVLYTPGFDVRKVIAWLLYFADKSFSEQSTD